jgi:hypothetical protein
VCPRAPQRQKKELSDVLPLEYFDNQMREVREGIQRVREGVTGELLAVSKANDPTFAPVTVGVGSAAAKAAAARGVETQSSYRKGDAAVEAALSRCGIPPLLSIAQLFSPVTLLPGVGK